MLPISEMRKLSSQESRSGHSSALTWELSTQFPGRCVLPASAYLMLGLRATLAKKQRAGQLGQAQGWECEAAAPVLSCTACSTWLRKDVKTLGLWLPLQCEQVVPFQPSFLCHLFNLKNCTSEKSRGIFSQRMGVWPVEMLREGEGGGKQGKAKVWNSD